MSRRLRLVLVLPVLGLLAAPSGATAATARFPSVSEVSPSRLGVGGTLTLLGRNFRSGTRKNTVVFKRDGARPVFVRAGRATSRKLVVKVPQKMIRSLKKKGDSPVSTRFRVRVLAKRFGKRYTALKASPILSPVTVDPDDADGDGLKDSIERRVGTDPLKADSDADGIEDGFEYYSAKDLNGASLPFPGKRPYPNPLDPADASIDHDGDGLSLANEFRAWRYTGRPFPLSYSDGNPFTRGQPLDSNKDVDGDGLPNYTEVAGPLSGPEWWAGFVEDNKCSPDYVESKYPGPLYTGLSFVDPDSDGDGVLDGADDIDHDGLTNAEEGQFRRPDWCQVYVSTRQGAHSGEPNPDRYARHDPFNPCKPVYSQACHQFVPLNYYVNTDTYVEDWAGAPPNR
ncbi:MAG: hypothetical protein H0V81_09550 [Solirubrobacterales bacterium]|nr:hypothetical protein [Solirubrobacterales bacterium]